jgi:hypothetical protein
MMLQRVKLAIVDRKGQETKMRRYPLWMVLGQKRV